MKLIVLFALVAVAASQYSSGSDKEAQIVKNDFIQAIDQSFRSDVETSNGIIQKVSGESVPGPEPETGTTRQKGSYEYQSPEGENIKVDWEADELGYRAYSKSLPVPPAPLQ